MAPKTVLTPNGCNHQGFLIDTVFEDVAIPNPEYKDDQTTSEPKPWRFLTVTTQAMCLNCGFQAKFQLPVNAKRVTQIRGMEGVND